MERKIVHVIGTGTIGEPLIGLLCDYEDQLGIDEVTFHKNSAARCGRPPSMHFSSFSSFPGRIARGYAGSARPLPEAPTAPSHQPPCTFPS